ncbi:MAG: YkgJ family cysteine cluster protein [Chthoniobacterales bacterium]|nr:YkgJ family cysteine cluster protein [Chthoniobacterales bacterium]
MASRLCSSCGLCCNGVLFHEVRVLPSDKPHQLTSLGIRIRSKKKEPFFDQPCVAFKNNCCSIYTERPTRCRLFECQQLKKVISGQSTEIEASEVIRSAHEKVDALTELLHLTGRFNPKKPLFKEVEKIRTGLLEQTEDKEAQKTAVALKKISQDLEGFLNKEFRITPLV